MAIIILFLIAVVSLVIVNIGSTAFRMTGLSRDVANFQAISCFFGVGFTTREAEMIVSHPVRRKVAMHLIVIGNIGIISAFGAVAITFMNNEQGLLAAKQEIPPEARLGIMLLGVLAIYVIFRMRLIKRVLEYTIQRTLEKSGVVRALDLDTMLRAGHGYVVSEFEIDPGHPLIGLCLGQSMLGQRGVLVLGIDRDNQDFVGAPSRRTVLKAGDVLTVYGLESAISSELSPDATLAALEAFGGTESR